MGLLQLKKPLLLQVRDRERQAKEWQEWEFIVPTTGEVGKMRLKTEGAWISTDELLVDGEWIDVTGLEAKEYPAPYNWKTEYSHNGYHNELDMIIEMYSYGDYRAQESWYGTGNVEINTDRPAVFVPEPEKDFDWYYIGEA